MKQYQLFVRLHALDEWSYVETYTDPNMAWTCLMMARARNCQGKVIGSTPVALPQDVLHA